MATKTSHQKEKIVAKSTYRQARISVRKMKATVNEIRGKKVPEAIEQLPFYSNKASTIVLQAVRSASANAKEKGLDPSSLYIHDIKLGPGITMKRGRFAAKGSFKPILKRTSRITVELSSPEKKKGAKDE